MTDQAHRGCSGNSSCRMALPTGEELALSQGRKVSLLWSAQRGNSHAQPYCMLAARTSSVLTLRMRATYLAKGSSSCSINY